MVQPGERPLFRAWPERWRDDPAYCRLAFIYTRHYGADRARDIIAGRDPKTNADLRHWDRIGDLAR